MDSACDARQNRPGSIPSQAEFVTAVLPKSPLQGTNIDLQRALALFLSIKEIYFHCQNVQFWFVSRSYTVSVNVHTDINTQTQKYIIISLPFN